MALSKIQEEFEGIGNWVTKFTIDGRSYGGWYDAMNDVRVERFYQWFPKAEKILELLNNSDRLKVTPDLWEVQNLFEGAKKVHLPRLMQAADRESQELVQELVKLGQRLFFHLEDSN